MGTTHFFYSNQLSLRKFWVDSTHDSKWLYKNWFESSHDSKRIFEIWFKSTHDSKSFQIFWFKSTNDSKLFRILIQNNSQLKKLWNIDANQVMTQWFESTADFVDLFLELHSILLTFFGLTLNFVDLFWAFTQIRWPFLGHSSSALIRINSWLKQYLQELNRFNSWLKRLSKNWLRINSWQVDSPRIDSDWIMTQSASPFFRIKSTHDSGEKHLTLSRLMIRLWAIPMSAIVTQRSRYSPNIISVTLHQTEFHH